MSSRLVLHIVTTLVLFALGWWLYIRIADSATDAIDSTNVATYWFATLVFILFSWIFYWFVHKFKLKAWIISLVIALVIAVSSTVALKMVADENQRKLEEAQIQQESDEAPEPALSEEEQAEKIEESLETLNLSEDE